MYKYLYIIILIIIYIYYSRLYIDTSDNYENNNYSIIKFKEYYSNIYNNMNKYYLDKKNSVIRRIIFKEKYDLDVNDDIKIHSIVFFHNHVNGDCFSSRILVKQIIDNLPNLNYYYTAPNSLISHCKDIGISDDNFNKIQIPNKFLVDNDSNYIFNKNGYLYINVWIGNSLNYESPQKLCWLCGSKYLQFYNYIITLLNQKLNITISLIETNDPYIPLNYDLYDCNFLNDYMINQKKKYNKIVLYYNLSVNTIVDLNKFDNNQIITNTYDPNILYITFLPTQLSYDNVISIKDIYDNYNKTLPIGFGIEFSYLSIYCDKVISKASGSMFPILNNQNKHLKNKLLIITGNNVDNLSLQITHDDPSKELACVAKFNWYMTVYNYSDNNNINMLCDFVNNFIKN